MSFRLLRGVLLALVVGAATPSRAGDAHARPLGACHVTHVFGAAFAGTPSRRLQEGSTIAPGERVLLSEEAEARLELRFADGSLLRLGPGSDATIVAGERRVLLRAGRVLVQADRMIGGVELFTVLAALMPLGTTYLVEIEDGGGSYVLVLEGALQVIRPPRAPEQVILPGEALRIGARGGVGPRTRCDLDAVLDGEALLRAFPTLLGTLDRLRDLADQQRRGVLARRNERLRRELGWRRPPRQPLILPELFR